MCLHYLESPSGHTENPIGHCCTFCFTLQTCFRKLKKRRKVCNMHLPIFLLSCSSLFLCQDSFNYHFLSISRNSLSHSFMVGLLATHPLSFLLPDTLLISPSFWRIVVLDIELWADSPFPWALEKCVTFFLVSIVSDEKKFIVIQIAFPLQENSHFAVFKISSFFL